MTQSPPGVGDSAAVARRLAPQLVTEGVERPITVDQTNHSVVVDEAVIVKWFVPPVPSPHPGVDLLRHLKAVGFAEMPRFFGVVDEDRSVVATAAEFVTGALDGWDWFVDELTGWADGEVADDQVNSSAVRLGSLAGDLHLALATPSEVIVDPVAIVDTDRERARLIDLHASARAVADGEVADMLDFHREPIGAVFARLPDGALPAIRLHGDLHIGQFLRAKDRILVTDFDGNPVLDASDRHVMRPAAVDLASLVQSVLHAGCVAAKRRPERAGDVLDMANQACTVTLTSYRAVVAASRPELLADDLFGALCVGQELHEIVYAARHLPHWRYVPLIALPLALEDA